MSNKIGAYICTGCGIGDALEADGLTKLAKGEYKASLCRVHPFLCSEEGIAQIKKDIVDEGVNGLVIAACSPRFKEEDFTFEGTVVERVNLREQCAWCQPPGEEDTQMLAEDLLRMAMVKAQKSEVPTPYAGPENGKGDFSKAILVLGGGLTGMNAALEAARAGYQVVLVEKAAQLGGYAAGLHKLVPSHPPYQDPEENNVPAVIEEVKGQEGIEVLTSAEIAKIAGGPGLFKATIRQQGADLDRRVGAVILATGSRPYDASKLAHLGYGRYPDVVTTAQLEEMAKRGAIVRPSDGKAPQSVAFVLCAGSRDPEHLPYCSSVCCLTSMKQAVYIKEQLPGAQVTFLYKDIRTPGQNEEFYRRVQRDGAVFIRGELLSLEQNGNGKLTMEANDVLLGDQVAVEDLDLVVLATGMVPSTKLERVEVKAEERVAADGPSVVEATEPLLLHLEYRQGPELPKLAYDFPDSHFICFPYETRRTGIYAAGCVRRPMGIQDSLNDGGGAALKAIQCVEMTSRGEAVHPRAGDRSFPEFFMQRCTQCKRCTEECPFGAINEDEKANPLPNPTRCRRCGICMGACPERIISFKNYSVDMIGSMIKAIEVPEEDEEKPRVVVLACENDAYPALDAMGLKGLHTSPYLRVIPLRCLGSMNLVWIADALSKGIDGILLLGCKHGDDYQCHFVHGSELASTRLSKVSETLDRLALESDRVRMEQVSITDHDRILTIFEEFLETMERVGPNPYKEM